MTDNSTITASSDTDVTTSSSKKVTITRKIQLLFNVDNKDDLKENYETLFRWQNIVHKAANMISTHHYVQENLKEMFYIKEDVKLKLMDTKKDDAGMLTTSKMNTTYQVLSEHFKGHIPMAIMTSLNSSIVQTFNKERKEYYLGKKSLRSYRSDIPIPVRAGDFTNFHKFTYMSKEEEGKIKEGRDHCFTLYGLPFRTRFGKDMSGNHIIFDRYRKGEYKLCDSSIQIKNGKIFLLAVFQFDKEKFAVDESLVAECFLDVEIPMVVSIDGKLTNIGTKAEFLYQRIAIQGALRRIQQQNRYTKGGRGRKRKTQSVDRFKEKETNYVNSKIHQYSKKLINTLLQYKVGTLVLKDQTTKEKEAKEDQEFVLRNWSYFSLKEKIKYKAEKVGINVVIE